MDERVARRIVDSARIGSGEAVVEIGPGDGALTSILVKSSRRVAAIEIDPLRAAQLRERFRDEPGFVLVEGDALARPLAAWMSQAGLDGPAVVIGNLPFNIATPLLTELLASAPLVSRIVATVQKEVARRIVARPGSPDYGFFSIRTAFAADAEILFDIPPGAFRPVPKVTSTVVRLVPAAPPGEPGVGAEAVALASLGFGSRRKTLANALAARGGRARWEELLARIGKSAMVRAEELTPSDFLSLAAAARGTA